jgi:hypothetical protein
MEKWSAKDYNGVSYPSDKLFFEAFDKFSQQFLVILVRFTRLKPRTF